MKLNVIHQLSKLINRTSKFKSCNGQFSAANSSDKYTTQKLNDSVTTLQDTEVASAVMISLTYKSEPFGLIDSVWSSEVLLVNMRKNQLVITISLVRTLTSNHGVTNENKRRNELQVCLYQFIFLKLKKKHIKQINCRSSNFKINQSSRKTAKTEKLNCQLSGSQ